MNFPQSSGGHPSRFPTLKQLTNSNFRLKTGIKIRALKHPQGNKLKWRKCEPRVWGGTTSWGEHPECSVAFRGRFYSPRPFCYFLGQCQKVRNTFLIRIRIIFKQNQLILVDTPQSLSFYNMLYLSVLTNNQLRSYCSSSFFSPKTNGLLLIYEYICIVL